MKIITSLFLIGKHLGKNFKFHNNVDINNDILSKFPSFYQDIFIKWINSYTAKPTLPFMILYDSKVHSKPAHFFSHKNLKFIGQLFNGNGNIKPWEDIKIEFHLKDTQKIYWLQIIDALPKSWKDILKDTGNANNLVIFDNHIVRKSQISSLINKLTRNFLLMQILLDQQLKIISRIFFNHSS